MLRDDDLVQRLEGDVELVGPHLEAPGVGGDAGDLGAVQPVGGGERQAGGGAAGVVAPAAPRRARGRSRPVRTSSRSPRPTRADSPCAAMVASRCSAVMANPSGSSPSVPMRPADVEQHAAAGDRRGDGLDAGDQVALAGDDVAGAAAVPGVAVVEDVAEAVPLGGALQRHGDHVVGAADAVREALVAALGVGAGVEHGVHRVGAPPPALLRAVRCRSDCASEKLAPRRTSAAPSRRLASSRKFSVPSTSSAPQRPQLEQRLAAAAIAPSGSRAVRAAGMSGTFSQRSYDDGVTREEEMCDAGHHGVDTGAV